MRNGAKARGARGDPWSGLSALVSEALEGELTVLGLISGTSADGVDAALVRWERGTPAFLGGRTFPYPVDLREALLEAPELSLRDLAVLDRRVAEVFAEAAAECIRALGERPDLVASHGQTVLHPPGEASTWQIGDPDLLADRLGLPVVADFRRADRAAGGEGAPLVPLADLDLFRGLGLPLWILNLGGIANLTYADAGGSCLASDLGPANALLDLACRMRDPEGPGYDRDGRLAGRGEAVPGFVDAFLAHPFFARGIPKSAGREEFGAAFLAGCEDAAGGLSLPDLCASICRACAAAVARGLRLFPPPEGETTIWVAGGGLRHPRLMAELRRGVPAFLFRSLEEGGFDPDLREAACFAAMGRRALLGWPGSLPGTTGAPVPLRLGRWSFPPRIVTREAAGKVRPSSPESR